MTAAPLDPDAYRRRQRRRALIGWIGGMLVVAGLVLAIVLGSDSDHGGGADVPYGEVMSSQDYEEVHQGEGETTVLERLGGTGRPERLTESYVRVLFPPAGEEVRCTYWEFTDEPEIFARLCFERDGGELVEKRRHSLFHPRPGGAGQMV
jgi:hypothetical protein